VTAMTSRADEPDVVGRLARRKMGDGGRDEKTVAETRRRWQRRGDSGKNEARGGWMAETKRAVAGWQRPSARWQRRGARWQDGRDKPCGGRVADTRSGRDEARGSRMAETRRAVAGWQRRGARWQNGRDKARGGKVAETRRTEAESRQMDRETRRANAEPRQTGRETWRERASTRHGRKDEQRNGETRCENDETRQNRFEIGDTRA
jgi:hypothetical protein